MDPNSVSATLSPALDKGLFELIGYLLTSARGLIDEPAEYGPFRLVEAVSLLSGLMADAGSRHAEFLRLMQRAVDEGKLSMMTDHQAFERMLDTAIMEFTRRLKQV